MKILVLNSRKYSLEYTLVELPREEIISRGIVERIGQEAAIISYRVGDRGEEEKIVKPVSDHLKALESIIEILTRSFIKSPREIEMIGHRVVHGGEDFKSPVRINEDVMAGISSNSKLAPLHNPYNLKAIEESLKLFPKIPHVAVFDTSFCQDLPPEAYYYPLPLYLYKEYKIRRYGFHGISHQYAAEAGSCLIRRPFDQLKIISFHLGAGSSIAAIKNGKVLDTSMGFSPLSGIMMTTRTGNIDPEIIIYLSKMGWSIQDIETLLHQESGLLGISGVSDHMRDVLAAREKGDKRADLAVKMFAYQAKKYFYTCYGILQGVDLITFTGGIAVDAPLIREMIVGEASFLGIRLDRRKNNRIAGRDTGLVHEVKSKTKIVVIPRNEALLIAREAYKLNRGKSGKRCI